MSRYLEALLAKNAKSGSRRAAAVTLLVLVLLAVLNIGSIPTIVSEIGGYFGYRFIRRAILVGMLTALCSALLGVTLVLKRYSMIGDGLSHVGFGAITVGVAMGFVTSESLPKFLPAGIKTAIANLCSGIAANPLVFTLPVVILLAILILRMNASSRMGGDAAIALLSTASLAVGVLVTSVTSGMNTDVMNYMFGSILALSDSDVLLTVVLSVLVLTLFFVFRNRLFAVTFDETFAEATGVRVKLYNTLIAVMTAVTIVVGMRMMGTMLISSLIIFPALTAMRVFSRFKSVLICASLVSVICFAVGIILSCLCSIPTGAGIVLVDLFVFVVFSLIGKIRS